MGKIYSSVVTRLEQCTLIDGYRIKVNSNGGMGGGSQNIYTDKCPWGLIDKKEIELVVDRKGDERWINPNWVSSIDKGTIIKVPTKNGMIFEYFVLNSDLEYIEIVNQGSTNTMNRIN